MALQGDLQSFALPDVLRLLAGTSKTGRLGVTGEERTGDVWLRDGQIVGGAVSSSPHAVDAADVVFELLRFESGSFAFEDDEEPAEAIEPTPVDEAIGRAEDLVREWDEVESVVPSVESWVTFAEEIDGESATVSADQWRVLAAIGGGLTVRELAEHFEQTDLAASRRVKDLVESRLVDLGEAPTDRGVESRTTEAAVPEHDDLSVLRADDGPVVLESREDALLPEPLPSAGTSFEGDLADMTSVDGRSFGSDDEDASSPYGSADAAAEPERFVPFDAAGDDQPERFVPFDAVGADEPEPFVPFDPSGSAEHEPYAAYAEPAEEPATDPFAAFGPDPAAHLSEAPAPAAAPAHDDPFGDSGTTFGDNDDFFGAPSGSNANEEAGDDPLASTPSTSAASAEAVEGDDADRGALLNFLSTVKR